MAWSDAVAAITLGVPRGRQQGAPSWSSGSPIATSPLTTARITRNAVRHASGPPCGRSGTGSDEARGASLTVGLRRPDDVQALRVNRISRERWLVSHLSQAARGILPGTADKGEVEVHRMNDGADAAV